MIPSDEKLTEFSDKLSDKAFDDKARTDKARPVTRLASVPGAFGAVLLIGAVAFGASSLRPPAPEAPEGAPGPVAATAASAPQHSEAAKPAHDPTKPDPKPTWKPRPEQTAKPTATPAAPTSEAPKPAATATPKPAATQQPKPAATAKPRPATTTLALEGWAKETKVKLAWKPYVGDGFEYYKVVRSGDASVSWPPSGDDEMVGAIGDVNAPYAADKPACGTPWRYAVFAVRHGEAGYVTLAASNIVTVATACAPAPTPIQVKPLAFSVQALAGQGIQLTWEACTADGFVAYKVVRSKYTADPRFPLNAGAELIGVIGDPAQTGYLDAAVAAGQTWYYRVVAVTSSDGGYVAICQTAVGSTTAQ